MQELKADQMVIAEQQLGKVTPFQGHAPLLLPVARVWNTSVICIPQRSYTRVHFTE